MDFEPKEPVADGNEFDGFTKQDPTSAEQAKESQEQYIEAMKKQEGEEERLRLEKEKLEQEE